MTGDAGKQLEFPVYQFHRIFCLSSANSTLDLVGKFLELRFWCTSFLNIKIGSVFKSLDRDLLASFSGEHNEGQIRRGSPDVF